MTAVTRPQHILKPPKFDGTTSFETFFAQFQNCVRHSRWDRSTEPVYLRNSLNKDVANVLWDYGKEVTKSLSGLTKILKMCFGGKTFVEKHHIEIRNRRRQKGETLQNLHSDIRRLAALAFPHIGYRSREMISTDYFLDALADPVFALKVRERHPKNLDSALRTALQLEVWTKDSETLKMKSPKTVRKESKKTREVTKCRTTAASATKRWNEMLLKLEEKTKRVQELESQIPKSCAKDDE